MDEGVDMQSECETDSLTESEVESQEDSGSGESGEEEEEGEREGKEEDEKEGEESGEEEEEEDKNTMERMEGGEMENRKDGEDNVEEIVDTGRVFDYSGRQSQSSHLTDQRSQASKLEESELEQPAELSTDAAEDTATVGDEAPQNLAAIAGTDSFSPSKDRSESTAHVGREKQPWELVDDPFKLLRIEQVLFYICRDTCVGVALQMMCVIQLCITKSVYTLIFAGV